ncbi:MAG: hypothetical protein ACRCXT_11940 [Paraclostridium sp.]
MNKELKEVILYDKQIDCSSYRLRYSEDEDVFTMQFADINKEEGIVNIHYGTEFDESGFKELIKYIFVASAEYYSLTGEDLIDKAIEELNQEAEEE